MAGLCLPSVHSFGLNIRENPRRYRTPAFSHRNAQTALAFPPNFGVSREGFTHDLTSIIGRYPGKLSREKTASGARFSPRCFSARAGTRCTAAALRLYGRSSDNRASSPHYPTPGFGLSPLPPFPGRPPVRPRSDAHARTAETRRAGRLAVSAQSRVPQFR